MVHVQDSRVRWSVRASCVARIVPAADWRAAPPIDVLAALGPTPRSRRIIVVQDARGREIAVLAAGAIDIGDVDPASVLPLPPVLAGSAPQIAALITWHDGSLSLLFELTAVTIPDPVVGEDLCLNRL